MALVGDPLEHPAAWRGEALLAREDWNVSLGDLDRREIEDALDRSESVAPEDLTTESFPLPTLSARLAAIQGSLETGSGATRVRGLSLAGWDENRIARAFWGLAQHVGTPVSQGADGARLLHVRDEGFAPGDPRFRGPHSNRRLLFHTDRCDVIAFLCVRPARSGGENEVLSSMSLYNEMLARHPDGLRVLGEPFPYLRHTVDSGNENAFTQMPVFAIHEGHFAASLLRVLIDRADQSPDAPNLTEEQRAALDTLETVAEDPALYARFRLEAGDVLFLNNWVTLHRRTAFEDHEQPDERRHLMRLWLSVPNSRPLDPGFREHFGASEAGALRGGMRESRGV